MNILLVNDDGFFAPGLISLRKILEKYATVYTVAPHNVQSGKSTGITFFNHLLVHQIDEKIRTVEGTPADCVIMASMMFKDKIDLVVSGVNNGYNLSYDSIYSGTCGAAYQALMFGIPAIAFSVQKFFDEPCQINEDMEKVFKYILDNKMTSDKYFLNVNMQERQFEHPKGIKLTRLYPRRSGFDRELVHIPKNEFKILYDYKIDYSDITYDIPATRQGYVSITPISLPTGNLEVLNSLKEKETNLWD